MAEVESRYKARLAALGIADERPEVDLSESLEMQAARFDSDREKLERLLREQEREHRQQAERERLEALRQSWIVSQRDCFSPRNAQPDLNVWDQAPRDTFRDPKRHRPEPPVSWITERR